MRRFRGGEGAFESHQPAGNSAELFRNYCAEFAAATQVRSSNPGQGSGFPLRGNEPHFTAKNLYGASMFSSPERMVSDPYMTKRPSTSPTRRCTSLADKGGNEFSPQSEGTNAEGNFTTKSQPAMRDISQSCSPGCQESRDTIVDVDSPFPSTNGRCLSASPVLLDELQRTRRRKRSSPMVETCPVCGITVRPSEVIPHMRQELESLERIPSETRKKITNYRRSSAERRSATFRCPGSTSATSATSSNKRLSDRDLSPKTNRNNRRKTYQKVRSNRVDRLNTRVGQCIPPHNVSSSFFGSTGHLWAASTSNGSGHLEDACCPVCSSRISGSLSSVNDHVEACLRRQRAASRQVDEEELVDVEGTLDVPSHNYGSSSGPGSNDDDRSNKSFGSEYEWCGQSRVRVSALAESASRLASSSGYHLIRPSSPGNDQFLNVEADDTQSFGPVQFTEEDLNSCRTNTDHTEENKTSKSDSLPVTSFANTSSSTDPESRDSTDDHVSPLEDATERSLRCNICMDTYTDPVASIQCWHVHCERCWLRALSVKKLCPQCNAITTATKLRRIFL
uniref:E3 ubiquitin-protein ligase RNF220-like n=1 Tax=Phallusia mammillata TaxID=59560 RepID=A0A6F9DRA7_9ASCI|nr:E3 ubiquitin-protein ligase RNF220-like [Phallusia mammillata]